MGSEELDQSGEWVFVDRRSVWRPYVASGWRPYSEGYWAWYASAGWTWISYEPFGYVTFHYGAWIHDPFYGWCWVPGYVWRPAHVAGVLVFVALGAALFATFSLVIACLVRTRERFMGIGQLITMPFFFASSAVYPLALMPG